MALYCGLRFRFWRPRVSGDSKINQLDLAEIKADDQVFRLQIAMNDARLVDRSQPRRDLVHQTEHLDVTDLIELDRVENQIFEGATVHELHDDADIAVLVLAQAVVFDHIGVFAALA